MKIVEKFTFKIFHIMKKLHKILFLGGGQFSGWHFSREYFSGGIFPGGNFPKTRNPYCVLVMKLGKIN